MTDSPLRPVWLSHHDAREADRCVLVGRTHVCRRCLAMFVGFVPAVVLLLSPWRDDLQAGDLGLVLALTIAAGLEFAQVARGRMPYSARRVLGLSPFVGMVLAWLGVTGVRDGFGPAHFLLTGAAGALLVLLLVRSRLQGALAS
ncbi:MAG TPA: hypothetical protein VFU14_12430 [Acidimicrobiales bacterium]|nr:hypothetical protein [Acidimicrobiales bacterium]